MSGQWIILPVVITGLSVNNLSDGGPALASGVKMPVLHRRRFQFAAAYALKNRHQLSLFYIELPFVNDFPFVKTTAAQRFTPVFFSRCFFLEGQDVSHLPVTHRADILHRSATHQHMTSRRVNPRKCGPEEKPVARYPASRQEL